MIKIKNWEELQHFKDRNPIWIKLYRRILDQRDIMTLSSDAFKFLVCLWLLASEDKKQSGTLPTVEDIAWRVKLSESRVKELLKEVDIFLISDGYQKDIPEKRREETEKETEKNYCFSDFWKVYPRKDNNKKAEQKFNLMSRKHGSSKIMNGLNVFIPLFAISGNQFTPMAATWLNQERFLDDPVEIQKQIEEKSKSLQPKTKEEKPIWFECQRRCNFWDSEKRWCEKFEKVEPKSCEFCKYFN
jgi:hypothetical protein